MTYDLLPLFYSLPGCQVDIMDQWMQEKNNERTLVLFIFQYQDKYRHREFDHTVSFLLVPGHMQIRRTMAWFCQVLSIFSG